MLKEGLVAEKNDLMCLDYNDSGTLLANAGSDGIIRIYDEITKKQLTEFEGKKFPTHDCKVFCVKFNPQDTNMVISTAWDHNMLIYDLRTSGPVHCVTDVEVYGDAVDFHKDGNMMLTG